MKSVKSVPKKLGIPTVFKLSQRRKDAKKSTKVLWEVIKRTLYEILVYPSAYVVKQVSAVSNYIVQESFVVRLGESWSRDRIILSWSQVKYDIQNWQDGHNVILHEESPSARQ